jgi:hypothetical protein
MQTYKVELTGAKPLGQLRNKKQCEADPNGTNWNQGGSQ